MALVSPMMASPTNGLSSAFSPYSDSPGSPAPPPTFGSIDKRSSDPPENRSSTPSENRASNPNDSLAPPPSPYPPGIEPSPVDSNGTETTEIEEDAQDDQLKSPQPAANGELLSPDVEITSPQITSPQITSPLITSPQSAASDRVSRIDTQLPPRRPSEDDPQSVIHAPSGFKHFDETKSLKESPTHFDAVQSPSTPEAISHPNEKKGSPMSPVNTDIPRFSDRTTPRAQTRQDLEEDWKRKSRRASSLEDIPEGLDQDDNKTEGPSTAGLVGDGEMSKVMEETLTTAEQNVNALRTALSECWTLCNTLANLSSTHRQRTFKWAGKQEVQEQAWRSCWRLCQQLYDSRDEDHASQIMATLELCRDFCGSLFEARQRVDEASDSVLRVSFELNNHLYNTHDRDLPEAFSERTLDFYITLCHRLMKQRTSLPQETDALLRACWSLAEMLFNLRQSTREGKNPDEELLGSAVQACWELCDLFREGWTQIRPDRNTPRPSQTVFPGHLSRNGSRQSETRSNSSMSNRQYHDAVATRSILPETPSTVFDDASTATSSPDSGNVPHILVLGPAGPASTGSGSVRGTHHDRWSSNASVLSGYSESVSSQRTSSTATASSEDAHLTRLRCLLLKAGMNIGFSKVSGLQLPDYIEKLPTSAFGSLPWQEKVFIYYKTLVLKDESMKTVHSMPSRRLGANELAKSVRWLGNSEGWAWMRDLYRIVFGFGIDEATGKGGSLQI